MEDDNVRAGVNDDPSMSELGKQFARSLAGVAKATFRAALSELNDEMTSELMKGNIPAPRVEDAVNEFDEAAASEWTRLSIGLQGSKPGRA